MSAPTLSRTPSPVPVPSPPAVRARRPGWRDPRLVAGIALVALSGLVGSRLLAGADDTVRVWTVRHDLVAGQVVSPDDLVATRVRFTDASDADRYLSAAQALAGRTVLRRDVGAGELVPRAALGPGGAGLVELPVAVSAAALPSTLDVGDLVDVWVTARGAARATQVLAAVTVLALPLERSSVTASTEGQVVLGLDAGSAPRLPEALALMADGTIVLTSRTTR